jgi:hypothetical protein
MTDQSGSGPNHRISGPDHSQMNLGLFTSMFDGPQESGIHTPKLRQSLGIHGVALARVLVDHRNHPSVGHDDLVAQLRQEPADPRRMQTCLKDHPSSRTLEMSPERTFGRANLLVRTFPSSSTSPSAVKREEGAVAIAHIQTGD